ncbi:MAG: Holliday junction resolvase RuvX [Candidatus Limnocylindrales bacterium]
MTRLLGVDLGERRIGLAIADEAEPTAHALATVRRRDIERDAATLREVAGEQRIDRIVVGMPLNTDGSVGPQAVATRAWITAVSPLLGLPVSERDERYSSQRATAALARPRRGRSGGVPSVAARSARRAAIEREAAKVILAAALAAVRG